MKIKFITLSLAILSLTAIGCTRPHSEKIALNDKPATTLNQPQYNGYIVTSDNKGEPAIRRTYSEFGIVAVRLIGNNQYELQLQNDPGLAELEKLATHSSGQIKAIQPNFIYKTL
ncbi:MAG: hypothetical protein HOO97_11160 [Sideroxydans sp.]|nr:hypothetical protein [Sideroxydans sp.]